VNTLSGIARMHGYLCREYLHEFRAIFFDGNENHVLKRLVGYVNKKQRSALTRIFTIGVQNK